MKDIRLSELNEMLDGQGCPNEGRGAIGRYVAVTWCVGAVTDTCETAEACLAALNRIHGGRAVADRESGDGSMTEPWTIESLAAANNGTGDDCDICRIVEG